MIFEQNNPNVVFQTDKEIEDYCIVKLVIQPILENAIYYGVGNMDEDDEGKITVRGEKKEDDIYIIIEDNGMGMRKEVLENILKDNNKVPKHGSEIIITASSFFCASIIQVIDSSVLYRKCGLI